MTRRKPGARRGGHLDLEWMLAETYGVAPDHWEPAVVMTAAEVLMWRHGVPAAKRQLARVNEMRAAAGVDPVLPGRGHVLSWDG